MSGQRTVVINATQWSVILSTTYSEITTGLSNVSSIPPNSGMLFDLGVDCNQIQINMQQMLFPLDIIFINSVSGVVGLLSNVQPGESDVYYKADNCLGARYFLEVNSGEAGGIEVGDNASIAGQAGEVQPAFWAALISALVAIAQIAIVGAGTYRVVKEELEKAKGEKK